ncbi:MAG TPA: tRNA isopentenyl-2-thiomethyl-A-37 hydroxylase MiaE [Steroidobacteraceae bacterium]|nr:tRNA isopentenyl-2-thiomethyl-A-37 hydroxylase MiaE [Steroidobacteraceae bacterium]
MKLAAPASAGAQSDEVLLAPTPAAWVTAAAVRWRELLIDHANCEKKAASTALALMFAYPEDRELTLTLSRLAREELRHFEQVVSLMNAQGVGFARQRPGRYAQKLRAALRTAEPQRKLDLLLMGALIEARSAERFRLLVAHLPRPLGPLYARLAGSEARHFAQYRDLARAAAPREWRARLATLAALEARLATSPDRTLRFHSGPPQDGQTLPAA